MTILSLIGYLGALGLGLSLGLVGGGGSILSFPIFVYLFGLDPVLSTSYSLFVVGLTALVGFWGAIHSKLVDWGSGLGFAIPSFLGVFLVRKFAMPAVPQIIAEFSSFTLTKPVLIISLFAVLMLAASYSMLRSNTTPRRLEIPQWQRILVIGLEGLVVGAVTGFVGAGGGFLIIPALVVLAGLKMKIAVGTSLGIIAAKSLLGFIGDLGGSLEIDWSFLIIFSVLAVLGILIGQRIRGRVSDLTLKRGFAWMVLGMGSVMILDQILKLQKP